ncbi:hypothetical protein BEI63_31425 [Eisenbergiella tayi]|uniref:Uncharacterized protein n=1 Tax=Eisenbergiella tayi TaxID=1432052 RepID=A0ABX3A6T7_9FIRM|nr:hypothetical protein BEI63_31425 [Eisenbergiella tayi]
MPYSGRLFVPFPASDFSVYQINAVFKRNPQIFLGNRKENYNESVCRGHPPARATKPVAEKCRKNHIIFRLKQQKNKRIFYKNELFSGKWL